MLIPAEQLKKTFQVEAKFYYAQVNEERFLMRRQARVFRKGSSQSTADAVFVMINPGGCLPEESVGNTEIAEAKFISAKPDPTQYQLMNLMERRSWNVITLINLSDICEGNMKNFISLEKEFNKANIAHSLFQQGNKKELKEVLTSTEHLIFAWGASDIAKKLASQFGLFHNGKLTDSYLHAKALVHLDKKYPRHPKPATAANRIIWLNEIEPLL